jgi:glyoxylase-like metal-dependent hydrolase (beta-lactamase superfamily II)
MSGLKVHHMNCATMCPVGASLVKREHFVCHCLLVETDDGLVLIDTGLGMADVRDGVPWTFKASMRPSLLEKETAIERVKSLGFSPEDVRHIVPTHLDIDHAGGLPDFPNAAVHVHAREHHAALGPVPFHQKMRYLQKQWAHEPDWHTYEVDGDAWFELEAVRELDGLPPEILLIPLHGHSPGHSGVAIESEDGWMLHAGDAYFHHDELSGAGPAAIKAFQKILSVDESARVRNQARLRDLAERTDVDIFCAHDEHEFITRDHVR